MTSEDFEKRQFIGHFDNKEDFSSRLEVNYRCSRVSINVQRLSTWDENPQWNYDHDAGVSFSIKEIPQLIQYLEQVKSKTLDNPEWVKTFEADEARIAEEFRLYEEQEKVSPKDLNDLDEL